MLIKLLRKIAQGSRLLLDLLGEGGGKEGRRKSSLALKCLWQELLQMWCKCLCFPEVLSFPSSGRSASQGSVSSRIRPVHWGFLNPPFLSFWRVFAMMKILASWSQVPGKCRGCSPSPLPSLSLLWCHVFPGSSTLALTRGHFSCNVPFHRAQRPSIMASKCTPRSCYFSLQTGDFN